MQAGRGPSGLRWRADLGLGFLVSAACFFSFLGLRDTFFDSLDQPRFLFKFLFTGVMALTGLVLAWRLARPVGALGNAPRAIWIAPALVVIACVAEMATTPESHPKDFTPVCTTELGAFARLKPEFDKRNAKVMGLTVDSVESTTVGRATSRRPRARARLPTHRGRGPESVYLYEIIHPNANNTLTVRSVFIIGPDKKVKLMLTYPASTGRNVEEILRVLDSLQFTATTRWRRRQTGRR